MSPTTQSPLLTLALILNIRVRPQRQIDSGEPIHAYTQNAFSFALFFTTMISTTIAVQHARIAAITLHTLQAFSQFVVLLDEDDGNATFWSW